MFATPALRAAGQPGFWKRSLDEFRRQANIAIRMEGLHRPSKPFPMISFEEQPSLDRCKVMCDGNIGGFSQASLTYVNGASHGATRPGGQPGRGAGAVVDSEQASETQPAHALFSGTISIELPSNRPDIQRSGYAGWRTRDRGLSLFGKLLWDIDPYTYLALRVRSDGRKYFVNIQTESIVPTDLHQHLLPCTSPGKWETIAIPFSQFVRTNHGMIVEPQKEMLRQRVRSVGISLIDRVPGPFELRIADVYATNKPPARQASSQDSGFGLREEEQSEKTGILDEVEPRRQPGEPEKILI